MRGSPVRSRSVALIGRTGGQADRRNVSSNAEGPAGRAPWVVDSRSQPGEWVGVSAPAPPPPIPPPPPPRAPPPPPPRPPIGSLFSMFIFQAPLKPVALPCASAGWRAEDARSGATVRN